MAVTVVDSGWTTDGTNLQTSMNLVTEGDLHQAGDLLLWSVVHSEGGAAFNITAPKGVVLSGAGGIVADIDSRHWSGAMDLDGNETTLQWTWPAGTGGTSSALGWIILRGCDEVAADFVSGTNWNEVVTTTGTTITSGALDQPAGSERITFVDTDASVAGTYSISGTSPVEHFDVGNLSGSALQVAGYSESFASSATGVTRVATYSASFAQHMATFVVTPAGGATGDAAVDTNATVDVGEDIRVRFELQEIGNGTAALPGLYLYASKNGGAYARVTTATDLRVVATTAFADGDATSNLMTGSTGTFVAGAGDEDAAIGAITIGPNGHTEVEWSLRIETAANGDTFDLRVYKSTGVALDSYASVPRLTAALVPTDPSIGLSPASLSFNATVNSSDPADKGVTITNTGAGTLNWTVSDDAAWLTCTPASGSLGAGAFETLTVSPATSGLAVGTHNATITIAGQSGTTNTPQTVAVTFNVTAVSGFPVALDGIYFEGSSFPGPHIDANGNLYLCTEAPNEVPTAQEQEELHIWKSTDQGHTWLYDIDGSNSPVFRDPESMSSWLDENGLLHFGWQKSGYNTYYSTFRTSAHATSPDTWGPAIDEVITGAQSGLSDQSTSVVARSDGTRVQFYIAANRDLGYRIRSTGGVWATAVLITGEFQQVFAERSQQDDTIHFVYYDYTAKTLHYNTLSPTDVLGTPQQLATGLHALHHPMVNRGLVCYDNAGVDHLYTAWARASDNKIVGIEITGGSAGSIEVISDVAAYINPVYLESNQPGGCLSYDQETGTVHLLWVDNATHDIWHQSRALGEAWTAPVELVDGQDVGTVAFNVIRYPGGDKVLSIYYDVDIGVASGGQPYYTEELLEAGGNPPVNLSAADGTATATGTLPVLSVTLTAATGTASAAAGTATLTVAVASSGGTATAAGGTATLSVALTAVSGAATAAGGTANIGTGSELTATTGTATAIGGTTGLTVRLAVTSGTATAAGGTDALTVRVDAIGSTATVQYPSSTTNPSTGTYPSSGATSAATAGATTFPIAWTYAATGGTAAGSGGTVNAGQVSGLTAGGGSSTAGGGLTSLRFTYLLSGGGAAGSGEWAGASTGAPPITHPTTGGTYDQTPTGGSYDQTPTGGTVVYRVRGGTVQNLSRGGTVRQPVRGGIPVEAGRGGTHDQSATGGEVL